jgi:hypothetical protein
MDTLHHEKSAEAAIADAASAPANPKTVVINFNHSRKEEPVNL